MVIKLSIFNWLKYFARCLEVYPSPLDSNLGLYHESFSLSCVGGEGVAQESRHPIIVK
jgi:hypothetical protein